MVRSMISRSKSPSFLRGEALKTANYILNRIPTKAVKSTPFEVWTRRKPSFGHFHVWGCKSEARFYNPSEKKLDSRTTTCYFIGYSEKSKGFKFYCPQAHSRIQETHNAVFIEDQNVADLITTEEFIFEELNDSQIANCPNNYIQVPVFQRSSIVEDKDTTMTNDVPQPVIDGQIETTTEAVLYQNGQPMQQPLR